VSGGLLNILRGGSNYTPAFNCGPSPPPPPPPSVYVVNLSFPLPFPFFFSPLVFFFPFSFFGPPVKETRDVLLGSRRTGPVIIIPFLHPSLLFPLFLFSPLSSPGLRTDYFCDFDISAVLGCPHDPTSLGSFPCVHCLPDLTWFQGCVFPQYLGLSHLRWVFPPLPFPRITAPPRAFRSLKTLKQLPSLPHPDPAKSFLHGLSLSFPYPRAFSPRTRGHPLPSPLRLVASITSRWMDQPWSTVGGIV